MLMLLFYVGDNLYALDTSHVVEVIPRVPLRQIHHVPAYVPGLLNYRGTIVPIVDLCHLIRGTASRFYLSTRIVMVSYEAKDKKPQYLGLIAERIVETFNKSEVEFIQSGIQSTSAPYMGPMIIDDRGMIQCIYLEHLFAEAQNTYLLTAGESYTDESFSH